MRENIFNKRRTRARMELNTHSINVAMACMMSETKKKVNKHQHKKTRDPIVVQTIVVVHCDDFYSTPYRQSVSFAIYTIPQIYKHTHANPSSFHHSSLVARCYEIIKLCKCVYFTWFFMHWWLPGMELFVRYFEFDANMLIERPTHVHTLSFISLK